MGTAAGTVTREAPSLLPACNRSMWVAVQVAVAVGSSLPALPGTALPSLPLPTTPQSTLLLPLLCVCCWLWPCHGLCIASFAAFCGRQAAALHCPPTLPPVLPSFHNAAHLFDHMQNSCNGSSCFALGCCIANATATATPSRRRRRLCLTLSATCQKKAEKNVATWWGSSAAETTLCFGINMSAIKLICVAYG